MKLRTLGITIALLFAFAGSTVAVVLITVADFLNETVEGLTQSLESVYNAEELEIALMLHNRDRFLADITGEPAYEAAIREREEQLTDLLEAGRKLVANREEAERFHATEVKVLAYLGDRRRGGEAGKSPLDAYRNTTAALETAFQAAEDLVQLNRDQALKRQAEAIRHEGQANRLGRIAIGFFCALLGMIVIIGHRSVMRPMMILRDTVRSFGQGNFKSRAPTHGLQELAEIGQVFNEMADRLARARDSQVRFLASVAHDLRNPLGAIKMSADLLTSETMMNGAQRQQMLDIISRQATRLDAMVGDLLELAKSESGQLQIHPSVQDLALLVSESARLYENVSTLHKVLVQCPRAPLFYNCDGNRMSQVLNNLLSNAIKYSPYGGTVTVACEADDKQLQIAVQDEGIGIDSDEVDRIFEAFRRSKNTQDTIPGVGLGLATSKKIVELHGGRIVVESEKGKGSIFRIVLPAGALTQNGGSSGPHSEMQ
jgi:signal transduction histidine kinase